jgi:hypothetical protein
MNRCARLRHLGVALALMLLAVATAVAEAASRDDLVGTWYGETQDYGVIEGRHFDMRRWTIVQTPDGTGLQVMRFYFQSAFVSEMVMSFTWGVDNDVWWVACVTLRDSLGLQNCAHLPRSDYRIDALDGRGMRYTSTPHNMSYFMQKVPRDFVFPR